MSEKPAISAEQRIHEMTKPLRDAMNEWQTAIGEFGTFSEVNAFVDGFNAASQRTAALEARVRELEDQIDEMQNEAAETAEQRESE